MLHQQIFIQTNLFHLMLRKPTKWLLLNVAGAKFFLLKLQSLSRIPRTEKDRYFIFLKFALVLTKSPYWDTVLSLGYHCDHFCLSVIIATSFVSRLSLRPLLSLGYHCDHFCLSVIIATSFVSRLSLRPVLIFVNREVTHG